MLAARNTCRTANTAAARTPFRPFSAPKAAARCQAQRNQGPAFADAALCATVTAALLLTPGSPRVQRVGWHQQQAQPPGWPCMRIATAQTYADDTSAPSSITLAGRQYTQICCRAGLLIHQQLHMETATAAAVAGECRLFAAASARSFFSCVCM